MLPKKGRAQWHGKVYVKQGEKITTVANKIISKRPFLS